LHKHPDGFFQVVLGNLHTGNPLSQILYQNAYLIEQLAPGDLDGVVTTIILLQLEHKQGREKSERPAPQS
jgi:hypothetical protein